MRLHDLRGGTLACSPNVVRHDGASESWAMAPFHTRLRTRVELCRDRVVVLSAVRFHQRLCSYIGTSSAAELIARHRANVPNKRPCFCFSFKPCRCCRQPESLRLLLVIQPSSGAARLHVWNFRTDQCDRHQSFPFLANVLTLAARGKNPHGRKSKCVLALRQGKDFG